MQLITVTPITTNQVIRTTWIYIVNLGSHLTMELYNFVYCMCNTTYECCTFVVLVCVYLSKYRLC